MGCAARGLLVCDDGVKVLWQSGRRLGGGVVFEAAFRLLFGCFSVAFRWHTRPHAVEFPILYPLVNPDICARVVLLKFTCTMVLSGIVRVCF